MASLALAWVMSNPKVTAPIVGPRRSEHFEPIREALALELDEDECAEIAALFNTTAQHCHSEHEKH